MKGENRERKEERKEERTSMHHFNLPSIRTLVHLLHINLL